MIEVYLQIRVYFLMVTCTSHFHFFHVHLISDQQTIWVKYEIYSIQCIHISINHCINHIQAQTYKHKQHNLLSTTKVWNCHAKMAGIHWYAAVIGPVPVHTQKVAIMTRLYSPCTSHHCLCSVHWSTQLALEGWRRSGARSIKHIILSNSNMFQSWNNPKIIIKGHSYNGCSLNTKFTVQQIRS